MAKALKNYTETGEDGHVKITPSPSPVPPWGLPPEALILGSDEVYVWRATLDRQSHCCGCPCLKQIRFSYGLIDNSSSQNLSGTRSWQKIIALWKARVSKRGTSAVSCISLPPLHEFCTIPTLCAPTKRCPKPSSSVATASVETLSSKHHCSSVTVVGRIESSAHATHWGSDPTIPARAAPGTLCVRPRSSLRSVP